MTNPDREELVKLADELIAQDYGNVRDADAMEEHFVLLAKAATALRRLASSDGGAKVRELEWVECPALGGGRKLVALDCFGHQFRRIDLPERDVDALKAAAQADYESRIRSALVEVPAVKGEPEPVAFRREISGINGHFIYSNIGDEGWEPLYTSPPADAGMREALEEIEALCRHLRQGGPDPMDLQELSDALEEATNLASEALTAPGATTKSDGGESFVTTGPDGGVTLDAYAGKSRDELKARCRELCSALNEWQFIAMEAATAHGNCLSNVPEHARTKIANMIEAYRDDDEPGLSDPSSTRSDVTVEDEPPENTTVGGITWHSSEEDSGPDVGISVYLGPDDRLWCGEISRRLFEEHDGPARFDSDLGAFIVRYAGKETTLIAKCADMDTGREFVEQIAEWVRKSALLDQFEQVAALRSKEQAAHEIAAAIRSGGGK